MRYVSCENACKMIVISGKLSLNKEFFIKAKDEDSGANGRLTYSFGKGKNQSNFEITTDNETVG